MLGAIAPQRRILRGPAPRPRQRPADTSAGNERRFLSNLEVLDALLAAADESLIARMSRLGMRRRQAHRFIIAATGRLLRAAQTQSGARPMRIAPGLLEAVDLVELAARTRVSQRQASCGLSILLPELAALVTSLRR